MRWAIISDIHANLQALEAVLLKADSVGWDRMICLGDIVGYGAEPNECVEQVSARCEATIMGNHDAAVLGVADTSRFSVPAREATQWTAEQLSDDSRRYLRDLPYSAEFDSFEIVHSTPEDPPAWHYLMTEFDAAALYDSFEKDLLFFGHTHVACVFQHLENGAVSQHEPHSFFLAPGSRYIVNAGSVGQPRDGDPRASFALLDTDAQRVEFFREEYDIEQAQRRIIDAGLPRILATRLSHGS
jgi:diadenosine tetraphosphatase ApaH/serine/threonine PP2A family protein phosphatase